MCYLLDTNHCVYLINGISKTPEKRKSEEINVIKKVTKILEDTLYISEATIGELIFGAERSKLKEQNLYNIEALKLTTTTLPIDSKTWQLYGKTKAILQSQGKVISDIDLLIACTAKQYNLILVSNDRAFESLPKDFQIETWAI